MASLTLKNIPDDVLEALRERAEAHHRSLNQEAILCLRLALATPRRTRADAEELLARLAQIKR